MSNAAAAQTSSRLTPPARAGWLSALAPDRSTRRAIVAIVAALLFWRLGSTSREWLGTPLPLIGAVPSPDAVLRAWSRLLFDPGYWQSWMWSSLRVALGFAAATLAGVPFGLALASNPTFRGAAFPVFELLRPIPPLAWVPAAIIFWPTQELSIDFVIFLGAFYTIVLNVVGGAQAIEIGRAHV
jgi:NitT/TauT family transport system permease protein